MIPQPVDVEFATVTEGPLRVTVQEDGKTRIREKYIVSAPVSGRISRIELDPGDTVIGDETRLAVIQPRDPAMLDARSRAQAEARVRSAEAAVQRSLSNSEQVTITHDFNQSIYERFKILIPDGAVSKIEFDTAKANFLASVQAIKAAKFDAEIAAFELEMAQAAANQFSDEQVNNLSKPFEIHAPIGGRVLRVFQESATVVEVGAFLLELGDLENLEIEIDVLSTDAVRVKPGAELTIQHWGGGSPLRGNVRVIEPAAFTKISSLGVEEQRVNIIADFNEPPERLATLGDGYRVEAEITVNELARALMIPNSALFRHQRQWHVLRVENGRARMQAVVIGLQNSMHTEIKTGLKQGDKIIIYPSDEIQSGTKVNLIQGE